MKKLALRECSGDWIYYLTALSYKEVFENVRKIDRELHESKSLSDMIQRSLTDNVDKIANYITNQPEHFFNALVLAVYDGDPQWREIKINYDNGESYELGVLEFNGDEIIFPVDGQHRVEGIKKVIAENPEKYNAETIPVIFIGHKNTQEGRQRTRRLFSTLNRYAKPVTLNDIIALDEDDIIAIATRHLIENNILFKETRLNNHKQKAIPEKDKTAFTNIITLYECNTELLKFFIKDVEIKIDGVRIKNGKKKVDAYCRFRRSEKEIKAFLTFVDDYWCNFIEYIDIIKKYVQTPIEEGPASLFRNSEGGHLLFRPVGQKPFVITALKLYEVAHNFSDVMKIMNKINLDLSTDLWTYIAWNPIAKKMVTSSNGKAIQLIMQYIIGVNELTEKELNDLVKAIQGYKADENMQQEEVIKLLNKYAVRT